MRLFFALRPDDGVAQQLFRVACGLNLDSRGRRVTPKNYHVTLAFVGEVDAARFAVLQQIGRSLRAPRFNFACDSLEYWQKSQVIVAAAPVVPAALHDFWIKLNDAIGLPRERLRAHVTLARKVAQAPVLQAMSSIVWRASNYSLIRSDTGGVESAYTVVDTWPLLDETETP